MQWAVMDVDGIDVCECGPQVHAKFKATRFLSWPGFETSNYVTPAQRP